MITFNEIQFCIEFVVDSILLLGRKYKQNLKIGFRKKISKMHVSKLILDYIVKEVIYKQDLNQESKTRKPNYIIFIHKKSSYLHNKHEEESRNNMDSFLNA